MTVKSHKATKSDEISLAIGMVVEVLQKSDSGWWLIRYETLKRLQWSKEWRSGEDKLWLVLCASLSLSFIEQVQQ